MLTDAVYERMVAVAERYAQGIAAAIEGVSLPWHVVRLGCRAEYAFLPKRLRNGAEAAAAQDDLLESYMHLAALNRGILLTPFHTMALVSPETTVADVDRAVPCSARPPTGWSARVAA